MYLSCYAFLFFPFCDLISEFYTNPLWFRILKSNISVLRHVAVKNFLSTWRWRPVKLPRTSCCSVLGSLWTSAAASCSPRAALERTATTSFSPTPTVCGRSVQVHPTSRRGRRWEEFLGIRSDALRLLNTCCFSQELNRRLRAPVEAFFTHLCQVVQPCLSGGDCRPDGAPQISLIREDDGDLRVKVKSELAGLPFYWEFHCSPAPLTVVRSIFHGRFWAKCDFKNWKHFYSTAGQKLPWSVFWFDWKEKEKKKWKKTFISIL